MVEIRDAFGNAARHGRARVNGIRMHYAELGEGEPLLLVHGTPKTHSYWYKLAPLLSADFRVIMPDLRGFGDTDRPLASGGYDSRTNATDLSQLMEQLGHETYHVHGEDRGAEFAYVLAATQPDRVKTLSLAEMLLSGAGLEEWSYFTEDNVRARFELRGVWQWHIPFFSIPDIPELLITGKERAFWEFWMKAETWNPSAIDEEVLNEWVHHLASPGGLRGVLETYRAAFTNAAINKELAKEKLKMPVSAIGAPEFFGTLVGEQMKDVASNVDRSEVFQECGHSLALEAPDRLAAHLKDFMLGR
jgi:pimeloyl-ACP methyl ester carboxylesterase